MENLQQFIEKQQAELEKKKQELVEFEALGDIPGLESWLIFSKLYGYRSIGFKLVNLQLWLEWAKQNCIPVHAIEGTYKTFRPEIPKTRDYADALIICSGDVKVRYSTILREVKISCFVKGYEINFSIKKYISDLVPKAIYRQYSDRYYGKKAIESWRKTGAGQKQYLRLAVDKQSADLETLLTWEQFENLFCGEK